MKILTKSKTKNWLNDKDLSVFIDEFYAESKEDFYYISDIEKNKPFFEGAKKYLKKSIEKKIKAAPNKA